MFERQLTRLEGEFYRGLNGVVEPLVRAGFGFPLLSPVGAIVLETTGRNTGRRLNVPLLATRAGNLLVVGTVRRRSQWLKNLAANREISYWMGGRQHEATALVFGPGSDAPPLDSLPPFARCFAQAMISYGRLFGAGVAILVPR